MSKPEWGTKRTCTTCAARFYDLGKEPILCPKCGAENDKDAAKARRVSKTTVARKIIPGRATVAPLEEEILEAEVEDDEAEETGLMEDTSDLGEDDEDMAEVIEHIESEDED